MFDEIAKLDNEIEKLTGEMFKTEGDVTEYHNKIEELENQRDAIYKKMADEITQNFLKKEQAFKEMSFVKGSDAYTLMERVATGQVKSYNTDDFQYGDWQSVVPLGWDLDRYFNAMHELHELFNHLGNFQVDVSNHFPEQQLYVRWENGIIVTMDFVIGQGSDFSLFLQSAKDKPRFDFVIDYNDAIDLCKKNAWKQALWYLRQIIPEETFENDLSGYDLSMLMFRLGQLSANGSKGFIEMTKDDWKQEIKEWKED